MTFPQVGVSADRYPKFGYLHYVATSAGSGVEETAMKYLRGEFIRTTNTTAAWISRPLGYW